jgi:cell volume regulation protein A
LLGGYLLVRLVNRIRLNEALYPLLALFGGILIFGLVSGINGSGFLAAYVAGLVAGNNRLRSLNAILNMNDAFAWLAQIGMFLILGLLVTPSELVTHAIPALVIATALILIARPLAVILCLSPLRFGWREQTYISWVGLRGAVPIILAMFPLLAGIENARPIFNVAFFVVLLSLVVQGASVAPVARWLKLDVRRDGAHRRRLELDVPGQVNYEVVGYTLERDNDVVGRSLVSLPLPGSVRIIGVMRRGALAPNSVRLSLRTGDIVYLLSHLKHIERLDQVFLTKRSTRPEEQLMGEFDVSGQASAADVFLLLGTGEEQVRPGDTIRSLFARAFDVPREGDFLQVGDYRIVAQHVEGNQVTSARVIYKGANRT